MPRAHRGVAFGDFDNDGRMDAVVTCLNDKPEIWMNHSPGHNHWLMLKLVGTRSNREGLGAKIKVTPDVGMPLYNHATTSVGFASSSDDRVHFGCAGHRGEQHRHPLAERHTPNAARCQGRSDTDGHRAALAASAAAHLNLDDLPAARRSREKGPID